MAVSSLGAPLRSFLPVVARSGVCAQVFGSGDTGPAGMGRWLQHEDESSRGKNRKELLEVVDMVSTSKVRGSG